MLLDIGFRAVKTGSISLLLDRTHGVQGPWDRFASARSTTENIQTPRVLAGGFHYRR